MQLIKFYVVIHKTLNDKNKQKQRHLVVLIAGAYAIPVHILVFIIEVQPQIVQILVVKDCRTNNNAVLFVLLIVRRRRHPHTASSSIARARRLHIVWPPFFPTLYQCQRLKRKDIKQTAVRREAGEVKIFCEHKVLMVPKTELHLVYDPNKF